LLISGLEVAGVIAGIVALAVLFLAATARRGVLVVRIRLWLLSGVVFVTRVNRQRRVSKGDGSAGTTGQQSRSHEAGRCGDAHTRTHVETTLQGVTGRLLR
jgi:hypothetical protein